MRYVRILVVDDEPSVRDALDRALRMDGYRCSSPLTAREALDALAHQPPDAIVLDVLMPEPDGLEVCRRLRAAGDRTPVLMLTARDAVPDRVKGLDAGADDYLVKPFALEELGARLRALLRRTGGPVGEKLRHAGIELDPAGPHRQPRRAPDRADPHRVPAARAAAAPPAPGADAHADLRARVGLRLRAELELARGLRRLPAPQARGGRRAAGAAHGPRRRLRRCASA